MSKTYNKEVIDFTNQCVKEITPEFDLEYCEENKILFHNDEVDSTSIELFTKESTDIAFGILYPQFKVINKK